MSSSFGPPGWADPITSTAPAPLRAPEPEPEPAPAPAVAPAPEPQPIVADADVYVRPERKELPEWTPPVDVAPAFVATTAVAPGHAFVPEDRRSFDGRRVRAYFIDSFLIGAIPTFLTLTSVVTEGAMLIFVAIQLIYYFLCEVTTGQTVGKSMMGLRVVSLDGTPATAKQVSARTVLRVLEQGLLGLIVMCLSGRRRRRLGDLAAGTVVVDATPDPGRPPSSPLLVIYPVAWVVGAIAGFSMIGHGGDVYLSEMDGLCQEAAGIVASAAPEQALQAGFQIREARFDVLRSVVPPPARRALHAELMQLEWAAVQAARQARGRINANPGSQASEMTGLAAAEAPLKARYAQLGLRHCAA